MHFFSLFKTWCFDTFAATKLQRHLRSTQCQRFWPASSDHVCDLNKIVQIEGTHNSKENCPSIFFNDWQNDSYLQSNLNQMLFAEVFSPLTNTLLNELFMNWLLRTPTHGKHHQHCQPSGFRICWHDNWRGPSKLGGIAVHGFLPKRKSMKYAMLVEFVVYTLSFHWRKAAGPKQCKEHKQVTTLSTEFRTMTKTHHYLPRTLNVIGFTNEITFQHQRFG